MRVVEVVEVVRVVEVVEVLGVVGVSEIHLSTGLHTYDTPLLNV